MQQAGVYAPLANHQFLRHPRQVYTAGGGRSNSRDLVMPLGRAYLRLHQVKVAPRKFSPLQAVTTVNTNQDSNIRKDKYFEVEMKVHDTELDQYGVVNNAIYNTYIQNGRDKLLESLGISVDSVTSKGNTMALSELHLKYFAPLRDSINEGTKTQFINSQICADHANGDRFIVKAKLVQIKGVRVIFEHMIETLPDHKLVLEAKGTAVCLDKDYRPTRVFPELSTKLLQFFSSKDD